jgi:hypothetical protein
VAACEFAVDAAEVRTDSVAHALESLRRSGSLSKEEKEEIDTLVSSLDDEYFRLQAENESNPTAEKAHLQFFSQARAVAAISSAANSDSLEAATEAIYEAAATVDDKGELFALILSALRKEE